MASLPTDRDRADDLMKSGRPAEAIPLYRKGVEAEPDEDSHLLALAWALHDSGNSDEAAVCFERLFRKELERRLFTGFAYDELVRIYREGNNREELVSVCERAAAAQPGDVGLLRTLGEAYLTAGNAAGAAGVFERLCGTDPEAPENWCSLGEARLAAGDPDQAEIAYGHAAGIDPSAAADFFSRLAEGLDRTGHPQRALKVWERSLAARPDAPPAWMGLGDCQLRLGKPDDAVRSYGRAADLQPAAAGGFWHRLGNQFARESLPLHAAEAFTQAIAAEPGNPLYHLRLAAAFAAGGKNDLAEAALLRAKALTPSPADPPG